MRKPLFILNLILIHGEVMINNLRFFSYIASFGAFTEASYNTPQDLKNKLANDRTACFELTNDIDLNGEYISPIFKASTTFNGTFDGKGYKIKNYKTGTKDSTTSLSGTAYAGLFGYIGAKGVVKDVTFENAELYLSRSSSLKATCDFLPLESL